MRSPALLLALGSLLTPAASAAEPAAPGANFKLVVRTSHVDYFVPKGGRVDVRRTEAFLDRLFSLLGAAPEGWRIQYYRHASVDELSARVGYRVSGVTDTGTGRIDSAWDYHPHELVHAVAGRLGRPPVFFAEGLAVALTGRGLWNGRAVDRVAAREMAVRRTLEPFLDAFGEQDPSTAYAVAGSFVAFLLDRDGIEPMLAFLQGCGAPGRSYDDAFRRAYGSSVARRTIEWMAWLRGGEEAGRRAWYDAEEWPAVLHRDRQRSDLAAAAPQTLPPPASPADGRSLAAPAR
jgi:hypothetical protein